MSSPYNFPNIYACQHACQLEDMPLYRCLAQKYGQRLLELGCGTGRITIPLAREGFYVDGVDRDPMMLNWAREQLKNETPQVQSRIHLLEMDITSMATGRQYDLVLFPYHSVGHLSPGQGISALAYAVADHMLPDGAFVLSVLQPDSDLCSEKPSDLRHLEEFHVPGLGMVDCYETTRYDATLRQLHFDWYYDLGDEEMLHIKNCLNLHSGQELEQAFRAAGLRLVETWGDFDGSAWSKDSGELIQLYQHILP